METYHQEVIIELILLSLAVYLLILAIAALLGYGRAVLSYPIDALYAWVRLIVWAITLGRVNLQFQRSRLRRRSSFRLRQIRREINQRLEERDEGQLLEKGQSPGRWASTKDDF